MGHHTNAHCRKPRTLARMSSVSVFCFFWTLDIRIVARRCLIKESYLRMCSVKCLDIAHSSQCPGPRFWTIDNCIAARNCPLCCLNIFYCPISTYRTLDFRANCHCSCFRTLYIRNVDAGIFFGYWNYF